MAIDWAARKAAAQKALDAAAMSADDAAEAEARADEARILAAARAAAKAKRDLDLARRMDAAREALGEKAQISAMEGEGDGLTHTFILWHKDSAAFMKWEKGIAASVLTGKTSNGTKIDRAEVNREFAMASVYDFDGATDLHGISSEKGAELLALMKDQAGLASSIAGVAAKLAGYALEERKS